MHKSPTEMSEKQIKNGFPVAKKSFSTNRNAFKNTFPLDGKIKLVAGVSQNGRKKNGFHQPENLFPVAGIKLFFKNWISRFPQTKQKSPNKRILLQLDRKVGFHQQEWRIRLRTRFCQMEKLLPLTGTSKKSKKMAANSSNKGFKQASL